MTKQSADVVDLEAVAMSRSTEMTAQEIVAQMKALRDIPSPQALRKEREIIGVSRAQLASLVGVDYQSIYWWETGKRRARADLAIKWASALRELRTLINAT